MPSASSDASPSDERSDGQNCRVELSADGDYALVDGNSVSSRDLGNAESSDLESYYEVADSDDCDDEFDNAQHALVVDVPGKDEGGDGEPQCERLSDFSSDDFNDCADFKENWYHKRAKFREEVREYWEDRDSY